MNLGLIGHKLGHSYSKTYFEHKFEALQLHDATYQLIELDGLNALPEAIERLHLDGFNVTIPYKRALLPLLDSLSPTASAVGAVNCVTVRWRGDGSYSLEGHNTDAPALLATLRPLLQPWHRQALILGSGGAARAAAWALRQQGIGYCYVSRQPFDADLPDGEQVVGYDALSAMPLQEFTLLINATPVGMHPSPDATPWPYPHLIGPRHLCYDLIYNPAPTLFLKEAALRGATTKDGLEMLHRQAELSWTLWNA